MLKRTTWILLGVLAVLIGVAFLTQRKVGETASDIKPTQTVTLLGSDGSDISKVEIANRQGQTVTAALNDQAWTIEPADATLTPGNIAELTTTLASTSVLATLQGSLPAEETGLDHPAYIIKTTSAAGLTQVIKIGNATPTGSGYYAQVDDGNTLVVGSVNIDRVVELALIGNPTAAPPDATDTPAS